MRELLTHFENKEPEIGFEWRDAETPARGRVVIVGDVSATIAQALERCHARSARHAETTSTALEIELDQLV